MKMKSIISLLFLFVVSILYFFGFCDWDLPVYLLCVFVTLLFMLVFIKQERDYEKLQKVKERRDKDLKRKTMNLKD